MKIRGSSITEIISSLSKVSMLIAGLLFLHSRVVVSFLNYDCAARRVISPQVISYSTTNYDLEGISSQDKKDYPLVPDSGKWSKLPEIWGKNADGVRDTRWLTLPVDNAQGLLEKIKKFVSDNFDDNKNQLKYSDIVVIGMGGSSRPADVIRGVLGRKKGYARIHVMENLDQEDIEKIKKDIDIKSTLFISISKSGTTAETMALTNIAYDWIQSAGLKPEEHFIAITTPAKFKKKGKLPALHQFLIDKNIPPENIFEHPDGVGGRYTIFSVIGMLPAALAGHDIGQILSVADGVRTNPDLNWKLGKFMADMEKDGRIYARIILPEELKSIGPWTEQLVAESQGKKAKNGANKGILPIAERDYDGSVYNNETFAIRFKFAGGDENDGFVKQITDKGIPVWEFTVQDEIEALGILYSLEFATGMSGIMMGINPFDQPGVDAGKKVTNDMKKAMLAEINSQGIKTRTAYNQELDSHRGGEWIEIAKGVKLYYGDFMRLRGDDFKNFAENEGVPDIKKISATKLYALMLSFVHTLKKDNKTYGAILPYAVEDFQKFPKRTKAWQAARRSLRKTAMQDLFGIGPIYEHSYRQYFMQGHDKGFFTFIVPTIAGTQKIPEDAIPDFTTGMQNALQALGTQQALTDIGRLSVRIEIAGNRGLDTVISDIEQFFKDVENEL